ncbi:MAG: hypothetical protein D6708_02895, partial [Candidatus Dadabacteria bacterium]
MDGSGSRLGGWIGGLLGLAGAGIAWAGWGAAGTGVAALGLAVAGLWPRAARPPETLREFLELAREHPEGPWAPLGQDLEDRLRRLDSHADAIRDVVRRMQEHATLLGWVLDNLGRAVQGAKEGLSVVEGAG